MREDMRERLIRVLASVQRGRLTWEDFDDLVNLYRYERDRAQRLQQEVYELEAEVFERRGYENTEV